MGEIKIPMSKDLKVRMLRALKNGYFLKGEFDDIIEELSGNKTGLEHLSFEELYELKYNKKYEDETI